VWNLKDKQSYYDFGVGTNIFILPKKLTLRLQYDYAKSNGNANFTLSDDALALANSSLVGVVANNNNIDIPNWDDYTKHSLMAKLIYNVTKHIALSVGYAYERFKYSDAQLDGYTNTPITLGVPDAYLTGAYSNQSYKANIGFVALSYKFW
jgi:opacity protein-like surface antigen